MSDLTGISYDDMTSGQRERALRPIILKLPSSEPREKVRERLNRNAMTLGANMARQERREELQDQLGTVNEHAAHLQAHIDNGEPHSAADVEQLAAWNAEAEQIRAELREFQAKSVQHKPMPPPAERRKLARLHRFVGGGDPLKWLWENRGATFKAVPMKIGATNMAALEGNRAEQDKIVSELVRCDTAGLSNAEAKVKAHQQIERLANAGEPSIDGLFRLIGIGSGVSNIRAQGAIRWPSAYETIAGTSIEIDEGSKLVAWLLKDKLIEAVDDLIDRRTPKGAMSVAERDAKIPELEAELLRLQRIEEAFVTALGVERRELIHPLAWLGIEIDTRAPKRQKIRSTIADGMTGPDPGPRTADRNPKKARLVAERTAKANAETAEADFG